MRFGFESEKILWDTSKKRVSNTALRTLQSLEDYRIAYGDEEVGRVTGEFVHSMIEMNSNPSESVFELARDYLFSYELVREGNSRTGKKTLPMGSAPLPFEVLMVSKWQYFVQNAILSNDPEIGWKLEPHHGLYPAANCAGVHLHAEIDTLPEHLSLTDELRDKFNLALSLAPFCAFASSPYFDGKHEAHSMRIRKYFFGVYQNFPEFGGVPPLAETSQDVLRYFMRSMTTWRDQATALGFDPKAMSMLASRGGANWGLVRYNRKWNTIEMRCFDTDLVGMDVGKLVVISRALKRSDLRGEALKTTLLRNPKAPLDPASMAAMIEECFEVSGGVVALPSTELLHTLIDLASLVGLHNDLVYRYLQKAFAFAGAIQDKKERWLAIDLERALLERITTADRILDFTGHKPTLSSEDVEGLIDMLLPMEDAQFERVAKRLPTDLQPPREHPSPLVGPSNPSPTKNPSERY